MEKEYYIIQMELLDKKEIGLTMNLLEIKSDNYIKLNLIIKYILIK